MDNAHPIEWGHTTAKDYSGNKAGIDLFDGVYQGQPQTDIYIRYEDGTRSPA